LRGGRVFFSGVYDQEMNAAIVAIVACLPLSTAPISTPPLDDRIDPSRMTTLPRPEVTTVASLERATPPSPVLRVAVRAADVPITEAAYGRARAAIASGLTYLAQRQSQRGTWFEGEQVEPTDMEPRQRAASVAVTALALKAFAQADGLVSNADGGALNASRTRAREAVDRAMTDAKVMDVVANGGIGNYVMSSVASALAAVGDADARLGAQRAIRWLAENQWDDAEGVDPTKDWYGGAGYGNGKRPDLSNTQMMLDAMHDAGVSPDDPAMERALAFVARTQNRKSSNPAQWAQNGEGDGGFVYSPANGGESFASDAAGEGRYGEKMTTRSLRSYGSMTYAGFKSLLYAGLSQDDPRVKDALGWIARHFTFEENPGLGQQGYFYYIHAMSRALHASQLDAVTDADGLRREWRVELIDALAGRQRPDGSWQNSVERWEESKEELATIYAVLALEEAIKPRKTTE
jgi:hypothetical protein